MNKFQFQVFPIFSFPEFKVSLAISSEPPSKSLQGLILFFLPSFYLIILLFRSSSRWFFMSQFNLQVFIKILVGRVQVSFFSRLEVQLNSPYSFELEFCISSFFSDIQIHSILLNSFHSILFQFFLEILCHVFIKYHSILSSSCSIPPCFNRSAA